MKEYLLPSANQRLENWAADKIDWMGHSVDLHCTLICTSCVSSQGLWNKMGSIVKVHSAANERHYHETDQ